MDASQYLKMHENLELIIFSVQGLNEEKALHPVINWDRLRYKKRFVQTFAGDLGSVLWSPPLLVDEVFQLEM